MLADLLVDPAPATQWDASGAGTRDRRSGRNGSMHRPRAPKPMLAGRTVNAMLRDQLAAEIHE